MKISRSLAAVALSGTLLLGGTTIAIAQVPEAADSMEGIPLPETFDVDGVTYIKKTKTGSNGEAEVYYESADGKQLTALQVKDLRDKRDAAKESDSESSTSETTSAEASASDTTTTTKATDLRAEGISHQLERDLVLQAC